MPRFILEFAPSNGFYKSLADNPRDRMTELAPVMQQAGLTRSSVIMWSGKTS